MRCLQLSDVCVSQQPMGLADSLSVTHMHRTTPFVWRAPVQPLPPSVLFIGPGVGCNDGQLEHIS